MAIKSVVDQAFLRESNLSSVLRFLHSEVSISRAQLAALTGLNKSTISSLVEELLERGLVHEIGINSVGAGRPAMLLEINPEAGSIIGVELGVDFIFVVITDFVGKIIWRRLAQADPAEEKETTLAQTLEIVNEAIKAGRELGLRPLGLGLATPGIVNLNEGVLVFAPNLHWRDVPLCKIFSEETGLRVFVENDANAAAVGEHLFGVARQSEDFIFVFAGVGIGGGLFLNGRLYRGNNGYAGEIGHSLITSESSKAPCHCGNRGCWETYANQYSIIQRIQARLEVKRSSIIPRLMMEQNAPLSIPLIKQAADLGDAEAIETFAEAGKSMGVGIASLVNIFNPQKIVLGGPLIVAGDYLLPAIRESIVMHSLLEIHKQVEVVLSAFGPDASAIGAISMVVDDILSNPSCVERR